MSEIIKFGSNGNQLPVAATNQELNEIANGILVDTRNSIANKTTMSMPIAQLATLGAGVASLLPAFRTVTQTTSLGTEGLFRLANASVGDALKVAKNGNFWGAFKTANGGSKFAQLQSVGNISGTATSVMPIDPATLMMAVALFAIEQQLGKIEETGKEILTFLQVEKEAEIEADIETLSGMLMKYKFNWDNEHFIASNHKLALDIQRTARKNMNAFQKQVTEAISGKKLFVSQAKVNEMLQDLLRKFRYYRMSLYSFALASFVEVMLSGDFKAENIEFVKDELEKMAATYRDIFNQSSMYLENLSGSAVETHLLKGIGGASKAVGKFIDSIPKIREGQVDEFLVDQGTKLQGNAVQMERKVVEAFAAISNPGLWMFVEKLDDMVQIYNRTEEICFDNNHIYLIAG